MVKVIELLALKIFFWSVPRIDHGADRSLEDQHVREIIFSL